jgi:hypothetical protein
LDHSSATSLSETDSASRPHSGTAASDVGSDFFEELLVNPALLTLARQRGELDCGGLRHLIVGYGNFNQIVVPAPSGHVSVCVERDADADEVAAQVAELLGASAGLNH